MIIFFLVSNLMIIMAHKKIWGDNGSLKFMGLNINFWWFWKQLELL